MERYPAFPAVSFSPVRGMSWFSEVDILHFLIAVLSRLQGSVQRGVIETNPLSCALCPKWEMWSFPVMVRNGAWMAI